MSFFLTFLGTSPAVCLVLSPILYTGFVAAARRLFAGSAPAGAGKDILGPVEDVLNKNPSQSLSGKTILCWGPMFMIHASWYLGVLVAGSLGILVHDS